MPENSSNKLRRKRLNSIAKVLRQFGLTDPGQIADALGEPPLPSHGALEKLLRSLDLRLPRNVSPRLIAQALLAAINEDSPLTLKWRETFGGTPNFAAIKPGAAHATRYHRTIFDSLKGIFDGTLSNGQIEQEINRGIHRVDIMFDNSADNGFFAQVGRRLNLPSSYVPTECKNYAADLGSPEYDQLSGRLNDEVGRVGLLVLRKINNPAKALEHQRAKWIKRELIIMLDDNDVLRMHKARYEGHPGDIEALLWKKVRQIRLNSTK